MFDLRFIDRRKKIAQIRIGAFMEDFGVSVNSSTSSLESEWLRRIGALLGRRKKVMVPVWQRGRVVSRAWLLYRVGDRVFVQERMFFRRFDPMKSRVPTRQTVIEDGQKISEWSVSIDAIAEFLRKRPNQAPEPTPPKRRGSP